MNRFVLYVGNSAAFRDAVVAQAEKTGDFVLNLGWHPKFPKEDEVFEACVLMSPRPSILLVDAAACKDAGADFIKRYRGLIGTAHARIYLCSAENLLAEWKKARDAGADGYIVESAGNLASILSHYFAVAA